MRRLRKNLHGRYDNADNPPLYQFSCTSIGDDEKGGERHGKTACTPFQPVPLRALRPPCRRGVRRGFLTYPSAGRVLRRLGDWSGPSALPLLGSADGPTAGRRARIIRSRPCPPETN
jgi:hypothetical protein